MAPVWVLFWIIVVAGELLPGESTPVELLAETHISDKIFHFGAYVPLAFVPVLAFRRRAAIFCVVAVALVSIGLEFAQLLVPGRTCEFGDAVANVIGLGVGSVLAVAVQRLKARRYADQRR